MMTSAAAYSFHKSSARVWEKIRKLGFKKGDQALSELLAWHFDPQY